MQDNNKIISKLRLERAEELIGEAEELLKIKKKIAMRMVNE